MAEKKAKYDSGYMYDLRNISKLKTKASFKILLIL